jgi:hypothetical protein
MRIDADDERFWEKNVAVNACVAVNERFCVRTLTATGVAKLCSERSITWQFLPSSPKNHAASCNPRCYRYGTFQTLIYFQLAVLKAMIPYKSCQLPHLSNHAAL